MKYINVRIPDDAHAWLKAAAAAEKITIQEFVQRMIEQEKARKKKPWIRTG
jgi:predicted HicB family RNase H-like nuclease